MKLTIDKADLQKGLSRIQALVEKRTTMPILANVLLEADEGKLWFSATDLEVGIRGAQNATVTDAGRITVSAKKFYEIVRELPEESVELSATPNAYLELRCARSRFVLAGTAAEEYPNLPGAAPENLVPIQAVLLSTMIERTMYATSLDETRYNLNGVYFEVLPEENKIRMVATDGHRLAYAERCIGEDASRLASGVIIPRKGLAELKRVVDEPDANEIELGFEANSGVVRKGDVTLVMRLIEGEFPNYRQVIPKESTIRLTLQQEALSQALRRVVLLSTERSRAVKLQLTRNRLTLSSSNPDLGEAEEEIDVDYSGDDVSIGFNARYLLDSLSGLRSKEVQLGLKDELSPVELRPTDDEETLAVVMPMRLS
ncbi:MAG: DNA polymerase III subunit beta [Deltaproteobacteria bacterium]|nr:MAG: DNA polymerase III subunit beta [Deltaproteobacteria bacterium]